MVIRQDTVTQTIVVHRVGRMDPRLDSRTSPRNDLHVPLELVDIIIDYLHSDKKALAACSLVVRGWRPSTCYHLFRSLSVRADAFINGFDGFLDFIEMTPSIQSYIHSLTLFGSRGAEKCLLGPYVLVSVLNFLPALKKLTLDSVSWSAALRRTRGGGTIRPGRWTVTWPPTPRPFATLRLHSIGSYDFRSSQLTQSTMQLLHVFSTLNRLEVVDITFDKKLASEMARVEIPRHLAVQAIFAENVHRTESLTVPLRHTLTPRALTELEWEVVSTSDANALGGLIRDSRRVLQSLTLDLHRLTREVATESVTGTMENLRISFCTALTHIHLRIRLHPEWSAPNDLRSGWPYASTILGLLPVCVEQILITFTHPEDSHEDAIEVGLDHFFRHIWETPWETVNANLVHCDSLKELKFDMRSNLTTKRQFKERMETYMPVLDARLILQFA